MSSQTMENMVKDVNSINKKIDRFKADAGFSSHKGSQPPSGFDIPSDPNPINELSIKSGDIEIGGSVQNQRFNDS
jgi:hypothetical protein